MATLPTPPTGTPANVVPLWDGKQWTFVAQSFFKGATGKTGPAGPAGPVGAAGAPGKTGPAGPQGPTAIVFWTGTSWPARTATTPVIWCSIGSTIASAPPSKDGDIWLASAADGKTIIA